MFLYINRIRVYEYIVLISAIYIIPQLLNEQKNKTYESVIQN